MKKYISIFFMSLFLAGCNTNLINQDLVNNLIQTPQIKDIQLNSFSADEQRVVFDVSVYNPNLFPLPISGLSGDFKLNNLSVGTIAANSDKNLSAQSTQVVTLPIKLDSDAFIKAAKSALSTQSANYNVNGDVITSAGSLPFTKSGELSVTDIIKTLLP